MKSGKGLSTVSAVMGVALCVALSAGVTRAQGPGDGPPGGGPGGGPGGNFGGPGGGRGGFGGGRMPSGTITAVDRNTGRLTIQSQGGGNDQTQTIQLQQTTQWVTQSVVTVADLKVGDQVQVQGVPTGITASALTAGDPPAFLQGGGPGGGPGGGQGAPGGANAGGPAGGPARGAGQAGQQPAFASATGRVTSVSPLTIALSGDVSLTVNLAANARITKYAPIAFSSVKAGDRVMIAGQAGQDGTFVATGVGVNLEAGGMGGFGRGGFGGRGGQGGFGGPGGQGGQGGQGGRGGRRGQGQGQGGQGQGGPGGGPGGGGEQDF
jgi:hypothetical protein